MERSKKQHPIALPFPQMSQQQYRDLKVLSNSYLKALRKSGQHYAQMLEFGYDDDKKPHQFVGQLADDFFLGDEDLFHNKYVLETWETPSSENQKLFAEAVLQGEDIQKAYDKNYSQKLSKAKLEEKSSELYGKLEKYIHHMQSEHAEKEPITHDHRELLDKMVGAVNRHPIARLFLGEPTNAVKRHRHIRLVEQIFGQQMKGEMDLVVHTKNFIWSLDLKTTSKPISQFPFSYFSYGYDYQQLIYYKLIKAFLASTDLPGEVKSKPVRSGIVAITTKDPIECWVFEAHPRSLVKAKQKLIKDLDLYRQYEKTNFLYPERTAKYGTELLVPYGMDLSILAENSED